MAVVVILVGLPGSGKSTLAALLCERFGFANIDRDALRAELFPDCRYTEEEKQAANAAVLESLKWQCAQGMSSLIDGMTFSRQSEREAVRAIAAENGCRFIMLWLDCSVEVAIARVQSSTHQAEDRDADLVKEVAGRFERPDDAIRLDATLPMDELCKLAEDALVS